MIILKKVSKKYGKVTVLSDISFEINPGEFVCITGRSGAGKSTLLHLLTGAEDATKGKIEVDGVSLEKVPPPIMQLFRQRVGIVFQDYKLLKNRTVEENIAFPLEVCGVSDSKIQRRVVEVLELVDMYRHRKTLPPALSGGEQARTALGRAIAHKPMILLADEPTGNIDPEQSLALMRLFQDIHKEGSTVILATHDSGLVDALQTRVIRLEDGEIKRDSVGGYHNEKSRKHHTENNGEKHQIFSKKPKPPKKKGGSGKSVKVTAIG